ncbi:MAG: CsbD family protein [Cyanobacteriota bacterium]|nr:CsbD family protein [Cyanobacteriota bacterium]
MSMSLEDKIKATAKQAEGRLQSAAGAITGDEQMKAEGEAKQVQAHLMDAAGNLKDKVQQAASSVGEAIEGLTGKGN